jgi:hypothetical protein
MAKGLVVVFEGEASALGLEKLERAKLYGTRRRIAVDADGKACAKAGLTDDGAVLLRPGMTAQGYFDAHGQQLELAALGAVDADGQALEPVPSTLGVEQALEGPVDARELLDLALTGVYRLRPEEVSPALSERLAAGAIFRTPFNYRPDFRSETAYLVQNDEATFALVGQPAPAVWLEPDAPPPAEPDDDDDVDELDFEMF